MEIGNLIRKKRLAMGYTKKRLGSECGITRQTIANLEAHNNTSFKNILKICEVLSIKVIIEDN